MNPPGTARLIGESVASGVLALALAVSLYATALTGTPLAYTGDSLLAFALVQGLAESGFSTLLPRLAAPAAGGLDMAAFPPGDPVNTAFLAPLAWLSGGDAVAAANRYFLLTFGLIAATATGACRRMGMAPWPAAAAGILTAFLPYHWQRNTSHLFLTNYALLPPAVAVAVGLSAGGGGMSAARGGPLRRWGPAAALGVALGFGGLYYAVFGAGVMALGGLLGTLQGDPGIVPAGPEPNSDTEHTPRTQTSPRLRAVVAGFALAALVMAFAGVRYASLAKDPAAAATMARSPSETDTHGLRLGHLVLPVQRHIVPAFARLRGQYDRQMAVAGGGSLGEGNLAALGFVGTVGLAACAWFLLTGRGGGGRNQVLPALARLNLALLAIASVGGLATVFAVAVTPQFRGIGRLGVVVGFVSVAAAMAVLQRVLETLPARWRRVGPPGAFAVVVALGVIDTNPPAAFGDPDRQAAEFSRDRKFVERIEATLPPRAAVYEWPPTAFPENGPVGAMGDYEHLKGVLHSKALRFSYGALPGSAVFDRTRALAALPAAEFVAAARSAGYAAVWIDRRATRPSAAGRATADQPDPFEAAVAAAPGVTGPILSTDSQRAVYVFCAR